MQLFFVFVLGYAAIACTGCMMPVRYTACPGASGMITDAESHDPVANAIVTIESYQSGEYQVTKGSTTMDGVFTIQPIRKWGIHVVPGDYFAGECWVAVEHPGYQKVMKRAAHYAGDRYLTNVSHLVLDRSYR